MSERQRYFGLFYDAADVICQFEADEKALDNADVLFAAYEQECYEGSATVVFRRDGKLYENHGGHCSCDGLEGQWSPEETTVEAFVMREPYRGLSSDAEDAWKEMLNELGAGNS